MLVIASSSVIDSDDSDCLRFVEMARASNVCSIVEHDGVGEMSSPCIVDDDTSMDRVESVGVGDRRNVAQEADFDDGGVSEFVRS
jgi:hypothetical protein